MTGKTHAGLGLCASLIICHVINIDTYTVISSVVVGSLLPDADTKKSVFYQLFAPLSFIVDKVTKHRGATHQVLPILLIVLYFFFQQNWLWLMGVGGITHTLIDIITNYIGITCNSIGEKVIYYMLWIANICLMVAFLLPKGYTFTF